MNEAAQRLINRPLTGELYRPLEVVRYQPEPDDATREGLGRRNKEGDTRRDWSSGSSEKEKPRPATTVLRRSCVILGDPGAGKSELLRHAVREELQRVIRSPSQPVPIYLRVADLGTAEKGLRSFVRKELPDASLDSDPKKHARLLVIHAAWRYLTGADPVQRLWLLQSWWNNWEAERAPFLALDGWDEAGDRAQLLPFLQQLLAEPRTVLTSRIVGYDGAQLRAQSEWRLQPLGLPQARIFVRALLPDRAVAETMARELELKPAVAHLAGNPLALALMCRVYAQDTPVTLPLRRGELYERILNYLLGRREAERRGANAQDWENTLSSKREFLEQLAWEKYTDVVAWSADELEERGMAFAKGKTVLNKFLRQAKQTLSECLINEHGLLVPYGAGSYALLHKALLDYLAACCLAKKINAGGLDAVLGVWEKGAFLEVTARHYLNRKAWSPAHQELISLLGGRVDDPQALILLIKDGEEDDLTLRRRLLAVNCSDEVPESKASRMLFHNESLSLKRLLEVTAKDERGWFSFGLVSHGPNFAASIAEIAGEIVSRLCTERDRTEALHLRRALKLIAPHLAGNRALIADAIRENIAELDNIHAIRNLAAALHELGEEPSFKLQSIAQRTWEELAAELRSENIYEDEGLENAQLAVETLYDIAPFLGKERLTIARAMTSLLSKKAHHLPAEISMPMLTALGRVISGLGVESRELADDILELLIAVGSDRTDLLRLRTSGLLKYITKCTPSAYEGRLASLIDRIGKGKGHHTQASIIEASKDLLPFDRKSQASLGIEIWTLLEMESEGQVRSAIYGFLTLWAYSSGYIGHDENPILDLLIEQLYRRRDLDPPDALLRTLEAFASLGCVASEAAIGKLRACIFSEGSWPYLSYHLLKIYSELSDDIQALCIEAGERILDALSEGDDSCSADLFVPLIAPFWGDQGPMLAGRLLVIFEGQKIENNHYSQNVLAAVSPYLRDGGRRVIQRLRVGINEVDPQLPTGIETLVELLPDSWTPQLKLIVEEMFLRTDVYDSESRLSLDGMWFGVRQSPRLKNLCLERIFSALTSPASQLDPLARELLRKVQSSYLAPELPLAFFAQDRIERIADLASL